MNLIDLIIIVVIAGALANGIRQGGALQVISFAGFWGGFALGVALAPLTARMASEPLTKALISMVTAFGVASVGGQVGRIFGGKAWSRLRKMNLGKVDSAAGAGVATLATLLAVWMVSSMLASAPIPLISEQIHQSKIAQTLTKTMPPAPGVFARFRRLIDSAGFPDVFAELEPDPGPVQTVSGDEDFRAAVAAARASTVKVTGIGCGGAVAGSGFVVSSTIVITNAHVVAGIDNISVSDRRGRRSADAILFDPELDIAVLRTSRLAGPPLRLLAGIAREGTGGAVLGHPGGGPLREVPARVMAEFEAVGRDIYSEKLTTRRVYQLNAEVHQGNSGGPFVAADGQVVGVIFSGSSVRPNVAYAIRSIDVRRKLDEASRRSGSTNTGKCAA